MTDARFPEKWVSDRRLLRLSDAAFRLFVNSLAWSVSNRTDGVLYDDDLALMVRVDPTRAVELGESGLWQREGDHWRIADFSSTQTSREQLEGLDQRRASDAARAKKYRAKKKASASRDASRDDHAGLYSKERDANRDASRSDQPAQSSRAAGQGTFSSRDASRDDKGQDRTGQATTETTDNRGADRSSKPSYVAAWERNPPIPFGGSRE